MPLDLVSLQVKVIGDSLYSFTEFARTLGAANVISDVILVPTTSQEVTRYSRDDDKSKDPPQ